MGFANLLPAPRSAPTLEKLQKPRMLSLEEEKAHQVHYISWDGEFILHGEGKS